MDQQNPEPLVLDTPFSRTVIRCPCGLPAAVQTDPPLCATCFLATDEPADDPQDERVRLWHREPEA